MKNLISILILWLIGLGGFAQKDNADEKTQEKNKKSDQDTRYQEGASGVKRSISYKFNMLFTDEDPGKGIFRYNNDTLSAITYIFVDVNDQSGEDQTKWYSTWDDTTGATGRGRINLVEYEGKNVNVFDVTGVFVRGAGYWKIPVRYVSGSLPADGVTYYYVFERIENKDKAAKTDKEKAADVAAVATEAAAVVTVAAVVAEPVQEPVVQVTQTEPVVEVKEEPVALPEPVVEVKEEPVAQPEPIAAAATAAVVTVAAVVTEPVQEPVVQITQAEPVVEVKEEPVALPEPVAQAEPVVDVREEPVTQPEPVPVVKEEPVNQAEPVKEEPKVAAVEAETAAAAVTVVAVASQIEKPKAEPRVRTTQPAQPAKKPQTTQPGQPKTSSRTSQPQQPAPVKQETPASQPEPINQAEPGVRTTQPAQPATKPRTTQPGQPKTSTQTSQPQQPAPVKKETPASQPEPKTYQPTQQTKPTTKTNQPTQQSQPIQQTQPVRPAPTTQAPSTGSTGPAYSFAKRTDGSRIWHGIIETGYAFKVSDYGLNNYRINFISSWRLGQHFMIGLGLGYRRYFDKPEKHTDWYMVSSGNQVPVFLDLRVLFSEKKLTPFLALGLGSSTEKSKTDTTSYGSFINPSAGIWYRLSRNTALFADIAWEMMDLEYALHADNIPYRRKNNSLSLNIGIQF